VNASEKVGITLHNKHFDHLTVSAPQEVPDYSIGKMPGFQSAAAFQPVHIFVRFIH
jgi:hypothetical protein